MTLQISRHAAQQLNGHIGESTRDTMEKCMEALRGIGPALEACPDGGFAQIAWVLLDNIASALGYENGFHDQDAQRHFNGAQELVVHSFPASAELDL